MAAALAFLSDNDFPEKSKRAMELFLDELATGQAKILSLHVEPATPNDWVVNAIDLAGDSVASIRADPTCLTVDALQSEIEQKASILTSRQSLVVGDQKLDTRSLRA